MLAFNIENIDFFFSHSNHDYKTELIEYKNNLSLFKKNLISFRDILNQILDSNIKDIASIKQSLLSFMGNAEIVINKAKKSFVYKDCKDIVDDLIDIVEDLGEIYEDIVLFKESLPKNKDWNNLMNDLENSYK